jgi:heat shock protein HslJ
MVPRRHAAIVLTGILCVFGLAACRTPSANDQRDATAGLPDLQQDLAAHEWLLDPGDSSPANRGAGPVTLVFGTDKVSGAGPCNSYRGDLSVDDDGDTIAITNLGQTNRACDPTTGRAEREYLAALQKVRDVDLSDGYNQRDLVLSNDTGDRLAFTAIDAHEQLVGTWHVVNLARDNAIRSVIDGTEPVLVFEEGGDVTLDTQDATPHAAASAWSETAWPWRTSRRRESTATPPPASWSRRTHSRTRCRPRRRYSSCPEP